MYSKSTRTPRAEKQSFRNCHCRTLKFGDESALQASARAWGRLVELTVRHSGDQVLDHNTSTSLYSDLSQPCRRMCMRWPGTVCLGGAEGEALTRTVPSTRRANDVEADSACRCRASSLAPSPVSSLGARVGGQKVWDPADTMDNHGSLINCGIWDDLGCILSHQERDRDDLGIRRGNGLYM